MSKEASNAEWIAEARSRTATIWMTSCLMPTDAWLISTLRKALCRLEAAEKENAELRKFHVKCESDAFAMLEKENAELRRDNRTFRELSKELERRTAILKEQDEELLKYRQVSAAKLDQPQWIPCSERLPEEGEPVLTFGEYAWVLARYVGNWIWRYDYGGADRELKGEVTHWMPLSSPPEEL